MKFEFLLLDCDGTLIISELLNNEAVAKALNQLGLTHYTTAVCMERFRGKSFTALHQEIMQTENIVIDKADFGGLIRKFSETNVALIQAVPNAMALLEQARIAKAVASNGHREFVLKYLKQVDLLKYFGDSNIFTQNQVARPKPYPDLFLHAATMNDVSCDKTIVVEDSATGIHAAKAAGMFALGFIGGSLEQERAAQELHAAGADHIITDLLEVLEFIRC
jgi:HAD superfamily hydrolase (TIGR01509 family)